MALHLLIVSQCYPTALALYTEYHTVPKYKDRLVRTAQTWGDKGNVELTVQEDLTNGVVLRGEELVLEEKKIVNPDIQLLGQVNSKIGRVSSQSAILEPANHVHPAGLMLHRVVQPVDLSQLPSLTNETGETILYSPSDNRWLAPDQAFIACSFNVEQMAYGSKLVNYLSTNEMMVEARKPKRWFGSDQQIAIHSRFVRPVLDLTLLMLGLPMVLGSIERNVFVSIGICFWI